jgi:hypothetical protein
VESATSVVIVETGAATVEASALIKEVNAARAIGLQPSFVRSARQ